MQIEFVSGPWTAEDKLKIWMLFVMLFSYMSWLVSGLNISFQDTPALGTVVSVVRAACD